MAEPNERELLRLKGFTSVTIDSIIGQGANISFDEILTMSLLEIEDLLRGRGIQLQAQEDINKGIADVLNLEDSTLQERLIERLIIAIVEDYLQQLRQKGYALYDDKGIYAISPPIAYVLVLSLLSDDETIARDLISKELEDYLMAMNLILGVEVTQAEVQGTVNDLWNHSDEIVGALIPEDEGVQSQFFPLMTLGFIALFETLQSIRDSQP